MSRLVLERGTDVLFLETGDHFLLEINDLPILIRMKVVATSKARMNITPMVKARMKVIPRGA